MTDFTGTLPAAGSTQLFTVDLQAGRQYIVDLFGSGATPLADPVLTILEADGTLAPAPSRRNPFDQTPRNPDDDGGMGANSQTFLVPEVSQVYDIRVAGFQASFGSFILRVVEDDYRGVIDGAAPSGDLVAAAALRGQVQFEGDRDVFTVNLVAGLTYTATLRGTDSGAGTLEDPVLSLIERVNAQNVLLVEDNDSGRGFDARLTYTPQATGIRFLEARDFGVGEGTYRIALSAGRGTEGGDVVTGSDLADRIDARAGEDRVNAGGGDDVVFGGADADRLRGGAGDDRLYGAAGNDLLRGGADDDRLGGLSGRDVLIGGAGADVFDFDRAGHSTARRPDVLRAGDEARAFDGAGAADGDRIDLRGIDADATRDGNQAFAFGAARGVGRLWVENDGEDTRVFGNVDRDAAAEFVLVIEDGATRAGRYVADDFVL
jgi:Ca2+-binding RTX toxin-like protein